MSAQVIFLLCKLIWQNKLHWCILMLSNQPLGNLLAWLDCSWCQTPWFDVQLSTLGGEGRPASADQALCKEVQGRSHVMGPSVLTPYQPLGKILPWLNLVFWHHINYSVSFMVGPSVLIPYQPLGKILPWLDLVSENKYSLICFTFTGTLNQLRFILFIHLSSHFIFSFFMSF